MEGEATVGSNNERVTRAPHKGHVIIERVHPVLDCGRHRVKAIVGDTIEVRADIFRDGPNVLQAVVRFQDGSASEWRENPMSLAGNDAWTGSFGVGELGTARYTIQAWTDHFATWRRNLFKRVDAKQAIDLELEEGALLLEARLALMPNEEHESVRSAIASLREPSAKKGWGDGRAVAAVDEGLAKLMARYPDRSEATTYEPAVELTVERERARFGAWYELFPRSTGTTTEHGTFATAAGHLPRIAEMGFDVVYLPPIHPIGETHRKGKNNALEAGPGDIGSPWAIGSKDGGHTAIHPQLGTMKDFEQFLDQARGLGLEVALDFAIQCSPDHPWVSEHPEWFFHRPDGSIKYAENPPKRYEDIFPINFDTEDRAGLWAELKAVLEFWISHGVKIFRVDNPHTKSFSFWEWVIGELRAEHEDLILLAEAFTRPKVMSALAKIGFSQSYTYFTWRNNKWELEEYLTQLAGAETALYFRPNFFVNTPDILHEYLQTGGVAAFKVRLVLAALLSPSYGIYSGFELFERTPVHEGSEEYLDSEKFELRPRDFEADDSLAPYIKAVNDLRHGHPAFRELTNLEFHFVDKDNMLAFSKTAPGASPILVVVNLNPFGWEEATVHLDLGVLGLDPDRTLRLRDVVTDQTHAWTGSHQYVALDPFVEPAHIFMVES